MKPTYNRLERIGILIVAFFIGYPIIFFIWLNEQYHKSRFYKYFSEPIYELNKIDTKNSNDFSIFKRIKK